MRFNSVVYWVFLLAVVIVVRALPARARKWWLLGASYLFYGSWHYPYLLLLAGVATVAHFGAIWISAAENRQRRGLVIVGANLALLAAFKYLDWGATTAKGLASWVGVTLELPIPDWVLPLGISFYVFEAISYTIDVMRKREKVHSFWDLQLFIAFFPKLIAGPILRAKELLPQVQKEWALRSDDLRRGLWLVASGLFLKIVVADGIARAVDGAFGRAAESLGAIDVAMMAVGFGMLIYFDFSGYSRIAIGSARLCGLELVDNFNHPYVARSPADFWNRWHMSLSRWIRDYLFYPLVGKKSSLGAMCRAALISMTLCGVWHGAGWTFVLWGFYHGALIAGYHVVTHRSKKAPKRAAATGATAQAREMLAIVVTFALVSLGWIFFRAESIEQAFGLLAHFVQPSHYLQRSLGGTFYLHVTLLVIAVWSAPSIARFAESVKTRFAPSPAWNRVFSPALEGVALGAMMVLCLVYLRGKTAFIYFQF